MTSTANVHNRAIREARFWLLILTLQCGYCYRDVNLVLRHHFFALLRRSLYVPRNVCFPLSMVIATSLFLQCPYKLSNFFLQAFELHI